MSYRVIVSFEGETDDERREEVRRIGIWCGENGVAARIDEQGYEGRLRDLLRETECARAFFVAYDRHRRELWFHIDDIEQAAKFRLMFG